MKKTKYYELDAEIEHVGNKMHKAFPLLVRKFPLPEGTSHCLKKNATARRKVLPLPEVCTGKFEQWQFRIQQYLQHEHYALWEVIEFGDSYKVPTTIDPNNTTTRKDDEKSRRTVTITTEDMQRKKNDVKARTTLLLSLPDEHHDSYKVPTNTNPDNTTTRKDDEQSGRSVTITTEDMQRKKNDVKARTTLLLSLPDEH
nr:hypothetical protein [Tanacetum cinerariifolium]